MSSFRYQAVEVNGASVEGVIEAEDRKAALRLLGQRGLFPSNLEIYISGLGATAALERVGNRRGNEAEKHLPDESVSLPQRLPLARAAEGETRVPATEGQGRESRAGTRIKRKEITAFTREMAALLGASIPIPQALGGLGEEEENLALREVVLKITDSVRKGAALSAAMEEHPKLFNKLYVSMVHVGEEAGALPKVMAELADLLEHEDEVRSEVISAVSYPVFVLAFGVFTVTLLLTVVLPRLFGMFEEMLPILPLPTLILLKVSGFFHHFWPWILTAVAGMGVALWRYFQTTQGAEVRDRTKLRLPLIGSVFRAAALSRFARTLGTLARSGVSLLPALKIVENTIGNHVLAQQIARVAEETRGGDSFAAPLRKLGIFPNTVVQMINVGEESGKLDEMLLKVADIEERQMRARTKTLISLLGPALILAVGALVGFIVIALLLPIFNMSQMLR
jgi:general secretion pathway protein F